MPSPSARLVIGLPENFPKQAGPEVFGLQSVGEIGWGLGFTRKVPEPKLKTKILS
jgi:hypothetical protein